MFCHESDLSQVKAVTTMIFVHIGGIRKRNRALWICRTYGVAERGFSPGTNGALHYCKSDSIDLVGTLHAHFDAVHFLARGDEKEVTVFAGEGHIARHLLFITASKK